MEISNNSNIQISKDDSGESTFLSFINGFQDKFNPDDKKIIHTLSNNNDILKENDEGYKRETIHIPSDIIKQIFEILNLDFNKTFLTRKEFKSKLMNIFKLGKNKVSIIQRDGNISIIKPASKEKRYEGFSNEQIRNDIKKYLDNDYNKHKFFYELIDSLNFTNYSKDEFKKFIEGDYLNLLHKALINKNLEFYDNVSLDKLAASGIGLETLREHFKFVIDILSIKLNEYLINNDKLNFDILDERINLFIYNRYNKFLLDVKGNRLSQLVNLFFRNFNLDFNIFFSSVLTQELSKSFKLTKGFHKALLKGIIYEYNNLVIEKLTNIVLLDLQKNDSLLNNKVYLLFSFFSGETIGKTTFPKLIFSDIKTENYNSKFIFTKLVQYCLRYKKITDDLTRLKKSKEDKIKKNKLINIKLIKIDRDILFYNNEVENIDNEILNLENIINNYKLSLKSKKKSVISKIIIRKDDYLEGLDSDLTILKNELFKNKFRIKQLNSDRITLNARLECLDYIEINIEKKFIDLNTIKIVYDRIKIELFRNILNAINKKEA